MQPNQPNLPWMPFYVDDFYASPRVHAMGLVGEAIYMRLLTRQWNEGSIPNDLETLARSVGLTLSAFKKIWKWISPCFESLEGDENRLINARLNEVREEQKRLREKAIENGKKGAEKRWKDNADKKAVAKEEQRGGNGDPISEPLQEQYQSKSKSKSSKDVTSYADKSATDEQGGTPPSLPGIGDVFEDIVRSGDEWLQEHVPVRFVRDWPSTPEGLIELAHDFMRIFGNLTDAEKITKAQPVWCDTLAQMRSRRGSCIGDAWSAMRSERLVNAGKPLFRAQVKTALSHLVVSGNANLTALGAYPKKLGTIVTVRGFDSKKQACGCFEYLPGTCRSDELRPGFDFTAPDHWLRDEEIAPKVQQWLAQGIDSGSWPNCNGEHARRSA